MRLALKLLLSFTFVACTVGKPVMVNLNPMTVNDFLRTPFLFDETMEDFKKNLPEETRVQKMVKRHPNPHHRPDTILNFVYKKSKVTFYKTRFNQETLLGGSVRNSQIELSNGIRQGMTKEQFFQSFLDIETIAKDSITLADERIGRTLNFYFKKNRLERFTFTGKR